MNRIHDFFSCLTKLHKKYYTPIEHYFLIFFLFFSLSASLALGCVDFLLMTVDGIPINGRSMDFNNIHAIASKLRAYPRGHSFQSKSPYQEPGLAWVSSYGFVGIEMLNRPCIVDGMNEKGLTFAYLWLDGSQYQEVPLEKTSQALAFEDAGFWILGNFSSIAEVKEHLSDIVIWGYLNDLLDMIPPLHIALHDAFGESLVIEFINGEMKVYDNPLGILANDPPFDEQLVWLNQASAEAMNSLRFGRLFQCIKWTIPPANAQKGTLLAFHLLNTVDIPFGDRRQERSPSFHYTLWTVVKDLANQLFYFKTYHDFCVHCIDLKKIDFSDASSQSVQMELAH